MARASSRSSWRWWIPILIPGTLTFFELLSVRAARGPAKRYIVVLKESAGNPGAVTARDSGRYRHGTHVAGIIAARDI
jgi:hypothetical protein